MNYVDVEEFSKLSGKTDSYIRRLCRENKLPSIQEIVPQTGKPKYLIDIDSAESKKYLSPVQSQNFKKNVTEQVPQHIFTSSDNMQELLKAKDQIIELKDQIIQYAEQAGQIKLLEDLDKRKQDEFLRQIAEFKQSNLILKRNFLITCFTLGIVIAGLIIYLLVKPEPVPVTKTVKVPVIKTIVKTVPASTAKGNKK